MSESYHVTVHAVTDICTLQEENISICHEALMHAERDAVTVHFHPESQYPGRYR